MLIIIILLLVFISFFIFGGNDHKIKKISPTLYIGDYSRDNHDFSFCLEKFTPQNKEYIEKIKKYTRENPELVFLNIAVLSGLYAFKRLRKHADIENSFLGGASTGILTGLVSTAAFCVPATLPALGVYYYAIHELTGMDLDN